VVLNDIRIAEAIAQLFYPFISLWVWYIVHKHNKEIKEQMAIRDHKQVEREQKINGRLDELIEAKTKIAHEEGRKIGVAEGLLLAKATNQGG
jgi:hypothetical protein